MKSSSAVFFWVSCFVIFTIGILACLAITKLGNADHHKHQYEIVMNDPNGCGPTEQKELKTSNDSANIKKDSPTIKKVTQAECSQVKKYHDNSAVNASLNFSQIVSNSIAMITAVITVIPIMFALFGYFRIKEIESTKEVLRNAAQDAVDEKLKKSIAKIEEEFADRIVNHSMESVTAKFRTLENSHILLVDAVKAFITNYGASSDAMTFADFAIISNFQNDLEKLSSKESDEIKLAISQLKRDAVDWSPTTCFFVQKYIVKMNQNGYFKDINTKQAYRSLFSTLEGITNVGLQAIIEPSEAQ